MNFSRALLDGRGQYYLREVWIHSSAPFECPIDAPTQVGTDFVFLKNRRKSVL